MKQKRHTPEGTIRLLREYDASGPKQENFCRQKRISVAALNEDVARKVFYTLNEARAVIGDWRRIY